MLKRTAIPGVFRAVKVSTDNFEKTLRGQTGIIFLKIISAEVAKALLIGQETISIYGTASV